MTIIDFAYSMTAPVEAIMFFLMFDAFFERRRQFAIWQYIAGVIVLAVLIKIVNSYFLFRASNATGMVVVAMNISFYFYRTSLIRRIFVPLFTWTVSIGVAEILVLNLISLVFGLTTNEAVSIPIYLVLGVIVSKFLGLIICYAIHVKNRYNFLELGISYWFLFILLFASSISASFMIYWMLFTLNNQKYNIIGMISSIGIYLGMFLALYLYERATRQNQIIHQQEQFEQQMNSQLKHMDEIILNQEELRRFKHDINNQIVALESYFESGDLEGGRRHMAALSQQFRATGATINTGNNALDAILSTKKSLAESKGIVFNNEIRIQERLPLDPKDLCIIFGNALDNAIEACDRLPEHAEKCIDLLLVQDAHSLFCTISNTALANNDRAFTTSKVDKVNHGFGLKNIRDALANYGAEMVIEQESETFSLSFSIVLISK